MVPGSSQEVLKTAREKQIELNLVLHLVQGTESAFEPDGTANVFGYVYQHSKKYPSVFPRLSSLKGVGSYVMKMVIFGKSMSELEPFQCSSVF